MVPGMEIITSDGRRIGFVGPPSQANVLHVALSPHTIPLDWIARDEGEVILRKTYAQMIAAWDSKPGPVVISGGKRFLSG
ncbi:MAG: hypothetical protein U1E67_22950 [Hyphomicrobiales bacterium]